MQNLIEDPRYCASSYLTYRIIIDETKTFSNSLKRIIYPTPANRTKIHNSRELEESLKTQTEKLLASGKKVALCLSGGVDSAILAKFLPKGTKAYTFKCIVPGKEVVDESPAAAKYAKECGLDHEIVEIYWEDCEKYATTLMRHKGAPLHSIEIQIYKAALKAKEDGIDVLIFGESADCLYGGQSMLFGQDWTFGEFVDRYTFVKPYAALKEYDFDLQPYRDAEINGYVDVQKFMGQTLFRESVNSYYNACETAGIECFIPFANTIFDGKLDKALLHAGKNKYLVREVFARLYPEFEMPPKTPMPRPTNEWFKDWQGPTRPEFWPHCTNPMNGDQRWLVWCLEKWLNILDEEA
jgi:asparagine synthetase B (glutamine-hydrolysing)